MKKWSWYVYIIECIDGNYYIGCTWNIPKRMDQHISQLGSKYTREHGFGKLVYYEKHEDLNMARQREIQIKDWSRKKKQKLIAGIWKKDW